MQITPNMGCKLDCQLAWFLDIWFHFWKCFIHYSASCLWSISVLPATFDPLILLYSLYNRATSKLKYVITGWAFSRQSWIFLYVIHVWSWINTIKIQPYIISLLCLQMSLIRTKSLPLLPICQVKSVKCYPGGRKFTSFHHYLRYSHKCGTNVFSIPGAILWV